MKPPLVAVGIVEDEDVVEDVADVDLVVVTTGPTTLPVAVAVAEEESDFLVRDFEAGFLPDDGSAFSSASFAFAFAFSPFYTDLK